jgi:hypothetical protein
MGCKEGLRSYTPEEKMEIRNNRDITATYATNTELYLGAKGGRNLISCYAAPSIESL